jgi:hypothetical protein
MAQIRRQKGLSRLSEFKRTIERDTNMKDCSKDIINYHDDEVTLSPKIRETLRANRNANRDRLKRGLETNKKPRPDEFIIQGSYAMKTMTQHAKNDYDIDDGAAFAEEKLKEDGMPLTPQQSKEMVRDALVEGGGLSGDPIVKKNCVRVKYAAGHHVDIPVYRVNGTGPTAKKELAGEEWLDSNPTEITDWFRNVEANTHKTGEVEPQLRRQVRLVKKYSRRNLEAKSPSGLILTVLAAEQHKTYDAREDRAFRETLRKIRDRLLVIQAVKNPANESEVLTRDQDAEKIGAFIDQIASSLKALAVLDKPNCRRSEALRAWKDVLRTDFFDSEIEKAEDDEKVEAEKAVIAFPHVAKPWSR